jgi:hypothetical protein
VRKDQRTTGERWTDRLSVADAAVPAAILIGALVICVLRAF